MLCLQQGKSAFKKSQLMWDTHSCVKPYVWDIGAFT